MLKIERNYEFRNRIDTVHRPGMSDPAASPQAGEILITPAWQLIAPADAPEAVRETLRDLEDYFAVSHNMHLAVADSGKNGIILNLDPACGLKKGSFELNVTENSAVITAATSGGIRRGGVYLEDLINLRGLPALAAGTVLREKLITPRIVHSGWGIELFPDSHLNAIMHAGFDAVAVFCTGYNRTNVGTLDFNDLIRRAAKYDIEVYLYAYLPSFKHPDDADAVEFFENVYTRLLEKVPAAGVMLVGESAVFPSKDPATSGKPYRQSVVDGIPDVRPCPGWWPCSDYPAFLTRVRDAIRKAVPDAKIIFNTYNWGWTELDVREKFLANLPEGITIQVTYDIFSKLIVDGQMRRVMDYSIAAAKPGYYFVSECQAAAKYQIPLLATSNTAGATWDIGVIPYVPVPQRWITRFKELDRFRRECGLNAFYDCHHYGWYSSVITELGKAYFNSPQCDLDELLKAWQIWSDAFDYLPATNEDQYGPLRVGAAYPLIFQPNITRTMSNKEIAFPADPNAHFGGGIVKTLYQPYENINQLPAALRYPNELRGLEKMLAMWDDGLEHYRHAFEKASGTGKDYLERELNLANFIRTALQTCYNTKSWYCLNRDLQNIRTAQEGLQILDRIEALAHTEIANAEKAMQFVQLDSRLGWEPSMEYVGDLWHLDWKIRQVKSALLEISDYRKILSLTGEEN